MINWKNIKHFKRHEFDSPDLEGSGDYMGEGFMRRLDALRGLMGKTFAINSGFRTAAHNKKEGGAIKSAHLRGRAVDLRWWGWSEVEKQKLIRLALQLGFTGLGEAHGFVHLDDMQHSEGYNRPARWDYKQGGKAGRSRPWVPIYQQPEGK